MNLKQVIMAGLVATLTTTVIAPALNAQTCSGDGDVVGVYAFLGSRSLLNGNSDSSGNSNTGNSGGTTGTTTASNTPLGLLLGDVSGTAVFGTVGRITADGAGNLFATPGPDSSIATQVGSYMVNRDCTISVTLADAFEGMAGTSGTGNNTGNGTTGGVPNSSVMPLSASFEGVVLNRGNEIDLVQAMSSSATGTATPVGANITLRKMFQATGCTNAILNGGFGMVSQATLSPSVANGGTGTGTGNNGNSGGTGNSGGNNNGGMGNGGTPASQSSFPLVGRFFANGDGTIVRMGGSSPLPGRQLVGSYTVNSDCTGTAQLMTNNGVTRNISFAIVQSSTGVCTNSSGAPQLLFGFTDQGINGFGTASQ